MMTVTGLCETDQLMIDCDIFLIELQEIIDYKMLQCKRIVNGKWKVSRIDHCCQLII